MRNNATHTKRIILALNPALAFHREVISGIGAFSQAAGLKWVYEIEPDFVNVLASSRTLDGCVVDADACEGLNAFLVMKDTPLVCVGSALSVCVPEDVSLLAPDNAAQVELAIQHLQEAGFSKFAFFAKPKYRDALWAKERFDAFSVLVPEGVGEWGCAPASTDISLVAWVRTLPERTGIVAVNDSSARELLQTCIAVGRRVPEDLAIIGIDNDPLVSALAPMPISSVIQGSVLLGRKAAELLYGLMREKRGAAVHVSVPPSGVYAAATSPKACPMLCEALAYISKHATHGVKAEQVAEHLGISRSTLERLFCDNLGYSAHEELLRIRLELAKKMLLSRKLSTDEVAQQSGFRTQQYMHVVFKREMGLSPREFVAKAEHDRAMEIRTQMTH